MPPRTTKPLTLYDELEKFRSLTSEAITRVALGAWRVAVDATPKKPSPPLPHYQRTGRLAAGWKLNTGRNVGLIPAVGQYGDPSGYKPDFRFDVKKDRAVRLYNNVPYAEYVENGVGNNAPPPRLMLKKATEYFDSRINSEFNKMNLKKL